MLLTAFLVVGFGCGSVKKAPTTEQERVLSSPAPTVPTAPKKESTQQEAGKVTPDTKRAVDEAAAKAKQESDDRKAKIAADKEKLRIVEEKLKLNKASEEFFGNLDSDQQRALLAAGKRLKAVASYDDLNREERSLLEAFPLTSAAAAEAAKKLAFGDPGFKEFAKVLDLSDKTDLFQTSAEAWGKADFVDRSSLLQTGVISLVRRFG